MLPFVLPATVPPNLAAWEALRDDRRELSGPERTIESDDGMFLVHYTTEGVDAAAGDEVAGHPDLVWGVLQGLLDGRLAFEDRGYRGLVGDTGLGGSTQIDVYIRDIDANGYAYPETPGDPSATGSSCYIEIDANLDVGEVPDSVTAHELHHCVQYRYTTSSESWIYEATATFEQYRVYRDPVLDLALGVLWVERLSRPDRSHNDLSGRYEYAGMVFLKWWEEFGGADPGRVVRLWEALSDEPIWQVTLDTEAELNWDLSWDEAFVEYAVWNAFACARDDGDHYQDLLACNIEVQVPALVLQADEEFAIDLPELDYSAMYARFDPGADRRPVRLECDEFATYADMDVQLFALDSGGQIAEQSRDYANGEFDEELDVRLQAELPAGGSVLAVFASVGRAPLDTLCTVSRVDAVVEEPESQCACASVQPAHGWLWLVACTAFLRRRHTRDGNAPVSPGTDVS